MITHRHARLRAAKRHATQLARRRRADRRGVLILVVLSLLVLFLLIGVAFVLSSGQFQASSKASARMDRVGTSSRILLEDAMHQLLRDTTNPRSVIRSHSLLRDLYGDDGFKGTIVSGAYTTGSGGQMLDLTISANGWNINAPFTNSAAALPLSTTPGAYGGCVMTVVSGNSKGVSMRIVGYDPATLTFTTLPVSGTLTPGGATQVRFVMNGRPFNGTGAGFVPPTLSGGNLMLGRCNTIEPQMLPAQTPVISNIAFNLSPNRRTDGPTLSTSYMSGGLDESWDAPDAANMFLGAVIQDPITGNVLPYTGLAANPGTIIPSFHRRELIDFHENRNTAPNAATNPARPERNKWSLRPSKPEEMNFYPDIVSPAANKESARLLDVDNDGDGILDSVWLDLGYPAQMGPNGVLMKPLFAFLCIDLDGRMNVNAHGNRSHYPTPPSPTTGQVLAGGVNTATMPAGQGLGPAEINLERFLNQPPLSLGVSSQVLLEGNGSWPGRYGIGGTASRPGIDGQQDVLAVSKFYDYPWNFFAPSTRGLRAFNAPGDLQGRLGFGLGVRGQILYDQLANTDDDLTDNPYEMNLGQGMVRGAERAQQPDMPFSPAELERVLRFADADASMLPPRLWNLLGPAVSTAANAALVRRSLTTDSFDLPVPPILPNPDYQEDYTSGGVPLTPLHITEMLRIKMLKNVPPVAAGSINAEINKMLSPDLMRGTRMDLNRPFGNAEDDNGNNQADEPLEPSEVWRYGVPGTTPGSVPFDYSSPGAPTLPIANNIQAKQAFARHLYVLAMLLKDKSQQIDFDGNPGNNSAAETARGLAQWAINVVDFRDADSVMTPFEFDLEPFDGWDVDGDLTTTGDTDRGLVWGCERPELLLTETFASHNRNTTDTNLAGAGDTFATTHVPANAANTDTTFDQDYAPQGTLMVELYNPWMGNAGTPADLNTGTPPGVQLNKVAGTTPVWRMLIVKGVSKTVDIDDTTLAQTTKDQFALDVERSIYFAQPPGPLGDAGAQQYYPSATVTGLFSGGVISVPPGSYAVVGSSGTITGTDYVSTVSQRQDGVFGILPNQQRAIHLTPPTMAGPPVVNNGATPADPSPPFPVIAVPIDSPRSVSVSEPTAGYAAGQSGGRYSPPLPLPLDNTPLFAGDTVLMLNGTTPNHRTIFLQRLANPSLDYNAQTNPYLTIDTMQINLTTYNGANNDTEPAQPPLVPSTVDNNATDSLNFVTVQRGDNNETGTPCNLWRREPIPSALKVSAAAATNNHYYNTVLKHTLGFLNTRFGTTPSVAVGDTGAPTEPFPLLNWNNRPYSSQYELMQVPYSRSSRLMVDYPIIQGSFSNPYTTTTGISANRLNFLITTTVPAGAAVPPAARRADLYRLLEYTYVPSRFLGTDYELNPTVFAAVPGPGVPGFRPPFNRVSAYREPGKVNINTIYTQAVWDAILDGHSGPSFNELVDSRRGYGSANAGIIVGNTGFPTYFVNPFRSPDANVMIPSGAMEKANPIDCTLLRAGATVGVPLFPPPTGPATGAFNSPLRNSKFYFEGVEHVANSVTTHSNVFAVWITVGFFEVNFASSTPYTLVATYPYTVAQPYFLDREVDSDIGAAKRARAFFIIDRSIPVAFEPGQNNNVDNAVLLRRFIE